MRETIEIVGVYPIAAEEPVHLIEIKAKNFSTPLDLIKITQKVPGQPKSNWQVPYDEKLLNPAGDTVVADGYELGKNQELLTGDFRLVFFFHYLDENQRLITPIHKLPLPKETRLPDRLSMIRYEEVD